jgi:Clp amino terminal domain, pathogenicity island component
MHDQYIAQDHILLALIKNSGISALFNEAGSRMLYCNFVETAGSKASLPSKVLTPLGSMQLISRSLPRKASWIPSLGEYVHSLPFNVLRKR